MGNAASSNAGLGATDKALHVLRVAEGSPAAEAGIEPFFDFVIGIDGVETELSPESLASTVESYESRPLTLLVHSSKRQETRYVTLTPSRQWSTPTLVLGKPSTRKQRSSRHNSHDQSSHDGHDHSSIHSAKSSDAGQASLLGLSLRFCTPQMALENVWHVLDVMEGSPAESAGLVPYGDWVIGWAGGVLNHENDFYDVVEAHIDRPLRIYVYSHDFDTLREVVLVPNRKWGGEGLLGSGIGYGLLHRIPKPNLRGDDEMPASAIKFDLVAEKYPTPRCIWNYANAHSLVIVTTNIGSGPSQRIDIEIVDGSSNGNTYLSKKSVKGETRLAVTTHENADVGVCFKNYLDYNAPNHIVHQRTVELEVDIGADAVDYNAIANQESLSVLEVEMRKLEGVVKEIVDELAYLQRREARMRDTNESTNARVQNFALITLVVLFCLGSWQILHLRSFFKRKYLID